MLALKSKPDSNSLAMIAGNIAKLHEEGIQMLNIFDLIIELPISKSYKESITKMKSLIMQGYSLEECFGYYKEIYPEFFIYMLSVAEKSGRVYETLELLEKYYEKDSMIRKEIRNALSYPVFIGVSMFTLIIFFCFFMIPNFFDMYISMEIAPPKASIFIYEAVTSFKEYPTEGMLYLICWIIGVPLIFISVVGKYVYKNYQYKIPIITTVDEYMTMFTLYIIISSGINLLEGLNHCIEGVKSRRIVSRLEAIHVDIMNGNTLAESIKISSNYSRHTISLVKLGEEGGSMEKRLRSCTSYLENKSVEEIDKKLKKIGPIAIAFMGIIVIIFILTFILPLFDSLMSGLS